MLKLTWSQAAAWRVRRHHLEERARPGSLLRVAGRLCGLHAQVLSCAELTAWARVEGLKRQAVQRALWQDRTLVKTWAMRGTLHLLPAGELPLWHAALGTSPRYLRPAAWQKNFGITMEELDRLTGAVAAALDGCVLTREELVAKLGPFGAKVAESCRDPSLLAVHARPQIAGQQVRLDAGQSLHASRDQARQRAARRWAYSCCNRNSDKCPASETPGSAVSNPDSPGRRGCSAETSG